MQEEPPGWCTIPVLNPYQYVLPDYERSMGELASYGKWVEAGINILTEEMGKPTITRAII